MLGLSVSLKITVRAALSSKIVFCTNHSSFPNTTTSSPSNTRRHDHLASISRQFVHHHGQLAMKENGLFGSDSKLKKALGKFHIYAGDGHFHAASLRDKRDIKNIKNEIGHLNTLNLRNQFLSHLGLGSDGTKKTAGQRR